MLQETTVMAPPNGLGQTRKEADWRPRRILSTKFFQDGRKYEVEWVERNTGKRYCCFIPGHLGDFKNLIRDFEQRYRRHRMLEKKLREQDYQLPDDEEEEDGSEDEEDSSLISEDNDVVDDDIITSEPATTSQLNRSIVSQNDNFSINKRIRTPCKRYLDFEEVTPAKRPRLNKTGPSPTINGPSLTSTPVQRLKSSKLAAASVNSTFVRTISSTSKGRKSTKVVDESFLYLPIDPDDLIETKVKKRRPKEEDLQQFYIEQSKQMTNFECQTPKSYRSNVSTCSMSARRSSTDSDCEAFLSPNGLKDKRTIQLEEYKAKGFKPVIISEGSKSCLVEFPVKNQPTVMLIPVEILSKVFEEEYESFMKEKRANHSKRPSLLSRNLSSQYSRLEVNGDFDDTCSRTSFSTTKNSRVQITLDLSPMESDDEEENEIDTEVKLLLESILDQVQESITSSSKMQESFFHFNSNGQQNDKDYDEDSQEEFMREEEHCL